MNDRRPEGPGSCGAPEPEPVPRDLPDQQADPDEEASDAEAETTRTPEEPTG
ncbi:hypothetical protein ABT160_05755 [Streptomyces sp. NPDC001941]|uniref:hypothetical protein n=1 Tax=Streptomyces sp. NPDC001941 TaxID=3154659 RepID=UPI00331B6328